jgi:hypothetical protein
LVLRVGAKVAKVIKRGTVDMGIGAGSVTLACAC